VGPGGDNGAAMGPATPSADPTVLALLRATSFGDLDAEALAGVARLLVRRRMPRGAVVFLEGEQGDRFFVVVEGRLKAFRHTPSARDITVFTLTAGDSFGLLPLLDGGVYPVSVAALSDAELLVLHRSDFLRFMRDNQQFCIALLAHLATRLRGCLDQIGMLGRQGAVARTAHGLLSLLPAGAARGGPLTLTLPFTQTEFAQILHITPENLSRALAALRRDGAVARLGPRRFRITSTARLQDVADGEA
jgi:CRP-like cAMP-binding protein